MRSYFSSNISDFILINENQVLGELSLHHSHALEDLQRNAWLKQIQILKDQLSTFPYGYIYFEFSIPRMGKRVDNIFIIKDLVFILEFKVGDSKYENYAIEQVMDYSLDLKNFHEGSHNAKIIPILVSTKAQPKFNALINHSDNLYSPLFANETNLNDVINLALGEAGETIIDPTSWSNSIYKPTPTIVEAAQALYRGHNVKEISRSDSGAINLSRTANCLNEVINYSKSNRKKSICFVTGVPGAGKTLAGLNIACERKIAGEDEHAVFLSGNGPLVKVLSEALTRDAVVLSKEKGIKINKSDAARETKQFIQNIHHFRDDNLIIHSAPIEKVVVFDEAQRAWTKEMTSSFMKRKKGIENFNKSEPEFLIDVMDRHQDWCTIICLIGGGQEINTGEAGLEEWINALKDHFDNWGIYYSNLVKNNNNYLSNVDLNKWLSTHGTEKTDLHLSVSLRSFRSEKLSDFIHALLEVDIKNAQSLYAEIRSSYPLYITRDLNGAKKWLKTKTRGSERSGIIASAGGKRLKSIGIDVENEISIEDWFLNDKNDVRSSMFLEDIATEFDIQGLEIDWSCVAWDANLFFDGVNWVYQAFKGTKWQAINQEVAKHYLLNSYRVLLTRARQGMVIFVPYGDKEDITRPMKFYDNTFNYLKLLGIQEI